MRNTNRSPWLSVAGVVLFVGAGCGDGDGDGKGGSKASGVTGSKSLNDLTDAEAKQFCEWTTDATYEPTKEELCTTLSAAFSSSKAECETAVKECLAEGDTEVEESDDDCSMARADEVPDNCTATVSELETCFKDSSAATAQLFSGTTCADVGKVDPQQDLAASCQTVERKCPGFFDEEDDGGGDSGSNGGVASPDDFKCANGEIIPDVFACDDEEDCADGSDEKNC